MNSRQKHKTRIKTAENGETLYKCGVCSRYLPEKDFYVDKRTNKPVHRCKSCAAEYQRERKKGIKLENKILRDAQLISCRRCGEETLYADWPRYDNGEKKPFCCQPSQKQKTEYLKSLAKRGFSFCNRCEEELPLHNFVPEKQRKDGSWRYHSYCKTCHSNSMAVRIGRSERRALVEKQSDGTLTSENVGRLFASTRTCPCCGLQMARNDKNMDHVFPLSKGGAHSIYNVVVLCKSCNGKKSDKPPDVWFSGLDMESKIRFVCHLQKSDYVRHLVWKIQ